MLLAALLTGGSAAGADDVPVEFVVRLPPDAGADAKVYLAGGAAALGGWRADGVALARTEDGRYRGSVLLPEGATIEYKITAGSWQTVERDASGRDIPNRTLIVRSGETVEIVVAAWASAPGRAGASKSTIPPAAGAARPRKQTMTGDIRHHAGFRSKHLGNDRTVVVYLPPDYRTETAKDRRYPVLYMHDGQNLFDAATSFLGIEWQADEHAERLIRAGRIEPVIIVGIYNTPDRMNEYTPWPDAGRNAGGRGDLYARFVVEEVKPFVDREYRTLPDRRHTAVAGSSLGGLISLHMARRHPDVFSMCGVISPALMWADRRILKEIESDAAAGAQWLSKARFWVDMGTAEGRQIDTFSRAITDTRLLISHFDRAGLAPGRNYYYQEVYEGEHNEAAWAARFDKVLLYFFAK